MYFSILSAALNGVEAVPVFVEADISEGMPSFTIVGSVSTQVREAQERVRTALKNQGIYLPPKRITLNLAPADIRKEGSRFDLPIAAAILVILARIPSESLDGAMILGELRLDGRINPVSGILPSVIAAKSGQVKKCIVPRDNYFEASAIKGIEIIGVASLEELMGYCCGTFRPEMPAYKESGKHELQPDFSDIKGQEAVKRAALISAAGFHNLLLSGPPGSGKSMTANRIPGILPEMTEKEQQEVSVIYSVAGLLTPEMPVIKHRPFRAPHHTLSAQALCGGGRIPRPGEITLAHRGVLFIDELPLMAAKNLEYLRGPLEDRMIRISRSGVSCTFPADFLFVAAMNPCPCGFYPNTERCSCTEKDIRSYYNRISQPILDRIDLRVDVPAVRFAELRAKKDKEISSAMLREKVSAAFEIQRERYKDLTFCFNSELPPALVDRYCVMTKGAGELLRNVYEKQLLSARGYHRVLKLSRTIADIEGAGEITEEHVSEALCFKVK